MNENSFDFDFGSLEIKDSVKEFSLPWFEAFDQWACLLVQSATDSNGRYQEAALARSSTRNRVIAASGNMTSKQANEDRDDDRELYTLYVVVGWRGIKDKSGNEVEFSREACRALLKAFPDWIFDKLRSFCMVAERFIPETPGNASDMAKN